MAFDLLGLTKNTCPNGPNPRIQHESYPNQASDTNTVPPETPVPTVPNVPNLQPDPTDILTASPASPIIDCTALPTVLS